MERVVWDEEKTEKAIYKAMSVLEIDRMPTSIELRNIRMSGLAASISDLGGFKVWAEKLSLNQKERFSKWSNEVIGMEILNAANLLGIERMPTSDELKSIGRGDLHSAISKSDLKYSGWSDSLCLERKKSETTLGQRYEEEVSRILSEKGYQVERMSTGHPYDLYVNGFLKIDVKVANVHMLRGKDRIHAIGISKKNPTCDLYICVLLDEKESVERIFVIPSHFLNQKMLQVGRKSKYDIYIDRYDYIEKYVNFYKGII